ncbi:MAG TPA: aminoacetone oxidase family FAD-binding enzyme, partial [Elusimicrobia bacterium]|nr:aminoacetone oxidase family FAD-binding enzyme [Elusimicrobiota bacterium]
PWEAPVGPVQAFARELKSFAAGIAGPLGFEDAMVTAGGCPLDGIDPASFASKKVPGLYVTGELLDVDGRSGGFNLHFAWTSGILAGRAAGRF